MAESLARTTVYILLTLSLMRRADALICYCTEDGCLSGERSNMCIQDDPDLGCYKQYYSKMQPVVTMGCVQYALLCDSSRIRPGPYDEEWPMTACCFTDHCNRNLPLPVQNYSEPTHRAEPATEKEQTTKPTTQLSKQTTVKKSTEALRRTNSDYDSSAVHPVFLLLIVLVVIFFFIVAASLLVIVKIWFYRRKKAKPQKRWIYQQSAMNSKAQMSQLLTEPSDSPTSCHEHNASHLTSASYDVP